MHVYQKGELEAFLNFCWSNVLFVSCETVINYQATRTIQVAVTRGLFRKADSLTPVFARPLPNPCCLQMYVHEHKGSGGRVHVALEKAAA